MPRDERSISLQESTWNLLEQVMTAFGHDSIEETIAIVTDIGFESIIVADSKDDPVVHLFGGTKRTIERPCNRCGELYTKEVYPNQRSVRLGK